jgi:hypothetical protein
MTTFLPHQILLDVALVGGGTFPRTQWSIISR